jgi:hypothetical protein
MFGNSSGLLYWHHARHCRIASEPARVVLESDAGEDQPTPKQTNGLNGSAAAASASASAGLAPAVSRW